MRRYNGSRYFPWIIQVESFQVKVAVRNWGLCVFKSGADPLVIELQRRKIRSGGFTER